MWGSLRDEVDGPLTSMWGRVGSRAGLVFPGSRIVYPECAVDLEVALLEVFFRLFQFSLWNKKLDHQLRIRLGRGS